MPTVGREHFDEYSPQTQGKHAILEKYFRGYLTALGRHVDAFHYVDGFAGKGTYGHNQPGSPLLAIAALTNQPKPSSVSLVESDPLTFEALEHAVRDRLPQLFEPLVVNAEFSAVALAVLSRPIYRRYNRVATFAFIDPCGVGGVRLDDIGRLLLLMHSECLLFWNYDGINRWIGGVAKQTHGSEGLREFLGGEERLQAALSIFRTQADAGRKEAELLALYVGALKEQAGAKFILPIRFQARGKARTSHYLIHCANHPIAFKIMKEVMWRATSDATDAGSFEFLQREELSGQLSLFRPAIDDALGSIFRELGTGDRPVSLFAEDWVLRPNDFLVEKQYKEILLSMEADGVIEFLDPITRSPKPRTQRMRAGRPTLASRLVVRRR